MATDAETPENETGCARCGRDVPPLGAPPYPGPAGQEVARRVCADCWAEWQQVEVMVINELKLNFMDPRAQEVLEQQMREFLGLDPTTAE